MAFRLLLPVTFFPCDYKSARILTFPTELEGHLLTHPFILSAAVIGLYSPSQATELPRAYVVLQPDIPANEKTAKEIAEWMKKKVARHKWLRGGVRFVNEIPQSASGKILRRELKDLAMRDQDEAEGKGAKAKL